MHIFIIIAINGVLDCKCTIRECPAAKAACPGVEYQPRLKFFIRFLPINRRKIVPRRIFTKLYGQVFIASHKFLPSSLIRRSRACPSFVISQPLNCAMSMPLPRFLKSSTIILSSSCL